MKMASSLSVKLGPLDTYRKRATFNWKKLRIVLDTEEVVKFQVSTKFYCLNYLKM